MKKTLTHKTIHKKPLDPVMAEVRQAKLKLLKQFSFDIDAMVRDARQRQALLGHPIVDRSVKA